MKKKLLGLLALATSMFAMTAEQLNEYKQNKMFNSNNVTFVKGVMLDKEFAQIKGYSVNNYGYSPVNIITNKKIVIFGKAYDANTRLPMNLQMDYDEFKKDAAYTIGTGKKEIMVFTEAECPYCKNFDPHLEKLKDEYTIYVYMFPLNSIHYIARDIAKATLAQKGEEAAKFYKRMLEIKDISVALPELEKYSVDVYKNILKGLNSFDKRASGLAQRYTGFVEKAYKVKFTDKNEVAKFCRKKISDFEQDKARYDRGLKLDIMLDGHSKLASAYLGVGGTPSIYDFKGGSIKTQTLMNR